MKLHLTAGLVYSFLQAAVSEHHCHQRHAWLVAELLPAGTLMYPSCNLATSLTPDPIVLGWGAETGRSSTAPRPAAVSADDAQPHTCRAAQDSLGPVFISRDFLGQRLVTLCLQLNISRILWVDVFIRGRHNNTAQLHSSMKGEQFLDRSESMQIMLTASHSVIPQIKWCAYTYRF